MSEANSGSAERLLMDIIDTVREPLLVLDADLRVTRANRAFFHTFRMGPEDTIGHVLFSLGNGQWDIPPLRQLLSDDLSLDGELHDVNVELVIPGVGRKIMLLNARLVMHSSPAIVLAIEDVTERRFSAERLAAQQLELQRSNAALNEFAIVASHDLQEPLRKILSFGERLGHSVGPLLDGNPRQYLDRMLGAAARMRTLINDLLAYSQVATSAERFAPTDLDAVAREVVADFETDIVEEGARVDLAHLPMIDAVERHGGRIAAMSRVGEGTRFTITLPSTYAEAGHVR